MLLTSLSNVDEKINYESYTIFQTLLVQMMQLSFKHLFNLIQTQAYMIIVRSLMGYQTYEIIS